MKLNKKIHKLIACFFAAIILTSVLPETVTAATGTLSVVYLSTVGSDSNDGATEETAVRTFAKAKELLAKDGTIYIDLDPNDSLQTGYASDGSTSVDEIWSFGEEYGDAKISVLPSSVINSTCIIYMRRTSSGNRTLTLQNIKFDLSNLEGVENAANINQIFDIRNKGAALIIGSGTEIICPTGMACVNDPATNVNVNRFVEVDATAIVTGAITKEEGSALTIIDNRTLTNTPETPTIDLQPISSTYVVGTTPAALTVIASKSDEGTLSYEWYSSTDNSSETTSDDIPVGLNNSYIPPTTPAGTTCYYCVVTNTLNNQTASVTSDVASVVVNEDTSYTSGDLTVNYYANYGGKITVNKESGEFTISATVDNYVIDTICVDGIPLSGIDDPIGKTSVTYKLEDGTTGTHSIEATYVYTLSFNSPTNGTVLISRDGEPITSGSIVRGGDVLTITATPDSGYELDEFTLVGMNDNGDGTYTVFGKTAPSIYVSFKSYQIASAPVITSQPVGGTYGVGDIAAALTVTASKSDNGTLSYQWYRSTDNSTETLSNDITVGNDISYIPTTSSPFTAYYYCVVTNTLGESTATVTSNIAEVVVTGDIKWDIKLYEVSNKPYDSYYTCSILVNGDSLGTEITPGTRLSKVAKEGDMITVALSIEDGNGLYSFNLDPDISYNTNQDGSYSFIMPASSVKIKAYTKPLKTITVDSGITNGTVTTDKDTYIKGETMTVTATPDEGYRLKSLLYSVDNGETWKNIIYNDSNIGTFSIQDDMLVTAEFTENVGTVSISTEAELIAFAQEVNGGDQCLGITVSLENDIELTEAWTPIGTKNVPFMGTFEGNGHTISGMNVNYDTYDSNNCYLGLFGYIDNGIIKDLTVNGTVTATEEDYNTSVGGIVGRASESTQIINCVNKADILITVNGNVGGIVGHFYGDTTAQILQCINYGNITVNRTRSANAGGIAGYSRSSIKQCGNYGAIKVNGEKVIEEGVYNGTPYHEEYSKAYGFAGGIVGNLCSYSIGVAYMDDCFNKGTVTGWGRNMGGLCGCADDFYSEIVFTNCYNTGTVSMTADMNTLGLEVACVSGLVGYVYYFSNVNGSVSITNCYNAGNISSAAVSGHGQLDELYTNDSGNCPNVTATNCYTSEDTITTEVLGDKYQEDVNSINGGNPLLWWEGASASDDEYLVTFTITPIDATLKVYTDSECTNEATGTNSTYSLKMGQYYYTVSADGYVTESGSFNVAGMDKTITVDLREAAEVTFTVTPKTASFTLTDNNEAEVTPESSNDGVYSFILYSGDTYTYTATANGYNGTTREYTAEDGGSITVALTKSGQVVTNETITGGDTISHGGIYNLAKDSTGTITISTTEPVKLVGTGTGVSNKYENIYIDCTVSGVNLTIQDLYIVNEIGSANMIDFMGEDNYFYFAGTSILDMNTGATGYAMIHVGGTAELTVGGVTDSDTLYFYKREQGAGIGGNGGAKGSDGKTPEYNGKITITGGNLFMKNSKQGALIGSGALASSAGGSPGDIIIKGGILNLVGISRAAAIGGGAGGSGGATGANVYIYPDACVNINVDFSGSAIGGGGYAEGNDSDGGTLYYHGGSIRTFVDYNAIACNLWPEISNYGVNEAVITADKVDSSGESVYLLTFDTSLLSKKANSFTVTDGVNTIYSGGLHKYSYVNESLYKNDQKTINYTIDNWEKLKDKNLYLYLTGEDHTLTVNSESFNVTWDSENKTFTLEKIASQGDTAGESANLGVKAETEGNISKVTVSETDITDSVNKALELAAKKGTKPKIEINVDVPETSTVVRTQIPKSSFSELVNSEIDSMTVVTPLGSVSFDNKVLSSIAGQAKESDVNISIERVDNSKLTKEQQTAVGDDVVIDLSINSGDTRISDFNGGTATVTIPYTLKDGETADGITIWYLDDTGKLTKMEGAKYDLDTGTVTFTTTHFSYYVVNYVPLNSWINPFTDIIKSDWYYEGVCFAVSKGLFSGTTETTFSPDLPMTRGMFATVLGRLDGVKEEDYDTSIYTDVADDMYFSPYIEWASKNNIVSGVGNGIFAPDNAITREEMAVMLYRYAMYKKLDITQTSDLSEFDDSAIISDWAVPAINWIVSKEIITGIGNSTISPKSTATRSQVAIILQRYCENIK